MTFPVRYEDVSSAENFQGLPADKPTEVMYKEGVYVGYRYFNTFNVKPAYEFGYGLSYTTFEYTDMRISDKMFDNELYVSVNVKNTGKVAGKEIVQLYLSSPTNVIDKPAKELKAFAKTRLLKPGEEQTITLRLTLRDLASFNQGKSAWVADKGSYQIEVAASALDTKLKESFMLPETKIVEKVNNVLNNKASFVDLKP